ncbi:hypothetical protein K501DRAFT_265332 [Backusella circina FSU 941]|nr:hypothetical protein K501DRAFT_265332 [Backusella circina FSU 941]
MSLLYKQPYVNIESTTPCAVFAKIAAVIVAVVLFDEYSHHVPTPLIKIQCFDNCCKVVLIGNDTSNMLLYMGTGYMFTIRLRIVLFKSVGWSCRHSVEEFIYYLKTLFIPFASSKDMVYYENSLIMKNNV